MKRPPLLLGLFALCLLLPGGYSTAGVATFDAMELRTSFGPLQMWQTSDWISADTMIAATGQGSQSFEEFDASPDWFCTVDYIPVVAPVLLIWDHPHNFISVYAEEPVTFSVLYYDRFGNPPLSGYPRVRYWLDGTSDCVIQPLDAAGTQDGCFLYRKEIPQLVPGKYHYQYLVRNSEYPQDYILETGSFNITQRPPQPNNSSLSRESTVSNSRVLLSWSIANYPEAGLKYRLFAGMIPDQLSLVYEGSEQSFYLTELGYGQRYYWRVESVNQLGVSSKSPTYSFNTIAAPPRAFNYPNPFNPALNETTNIVFDMSNRGSAEISIYTEMGDICWSKSLDGLPQGVNEVRYDGKDDHGRLLYNGTYICAIKKRYSDRTDNDRCRILIVK